MGIFNTVANVARHVVGKVGHYAKKIGHFIAQNHQHIAPLAHGLAMASGNETAQKITGAMLAGSQLVSGIENHVRGQVDAMRAHHAAPRFDPSVALGTPVK